MAESLLCEGELTSVGASSPAQLKGVCNPTPANEDEKRPKRKVAIVFGYVGERYCGLQWNHDPSNPTIEEQLLNALHSSGLISTANMGPDVMQKLGWERASRTDKGVHALKNLVSVRLMLPALPTANADSSLTDAPVDEAALWKIAVDRLNAALPPDIHVYSIAPVTRSFNGYQMCHGRRYEYFLPTFALMTASEYRELMPASVAPSNPTEEDLENDDKQHYEAVASSAADEAAGEMPLKPAKKRRFEGIDETGFERIIVYRTIPEDVMRRLSSYRISPTQLERARKLFGAYVGTLRYHNFTPGGKSSDASTNRYIRSVTVDDPVVVIPGEDDVLAKGYKTPPAYHPHGLEWVRIELDGQSFMLNQIRKMIGAVCSIMIAGLPDAYLSELLQKDVSRGVPMAPANGLFLSHLDFTKYNLRLTRIQDEGQNGSGKQGVYMDDVPAEEVAALRRNVVDVIARREMRENITGRWLRSERHVLRLAWGVTLE